MTAHSVCTCSRFGRWLKKGLRCRRTTRRRHGTESKGGMVEPHDAAVECAPESSSDCWRMAKCGDLTIITSNN